MIFQDLLGGILLCCLAGGVRWPPPSFWVKVAVILSKKSLDKQLMNPLGLHRQAQDNKVGMMEEPALIRQCQMTMSSPGNDYPFDFQLPISPQICSSGFDITQIAPPGIRCQPQGNQPGAAVSSSSSCSQIISFGRSDDGSPPMAAAQVGFKWFNDDAVVKSNYGHKRSSSALHSQDEHVMAERKRREKLNQRFIALSSLLPGLKKLDKASILGHATTYLKQLQEQLNTLEKQTTKKTVESVVFMKKHWVSYTDDGNYLSGTENHGDHPLPDVEARVSNKDVLLRIHCEQKKGTVAKILREIGELHLNTVNCSALPFGNYNMDITVVAQMEDDFCITAKELVKYLREALQSFH
ncbi:hypothetical protein Nepgr_025970 [Nepenthes gracilis]|uniref:BHLH domain-containing protein n=1 Tax=Nepenthes gracilis TaxID=150966 RepID=A0AAD3T7F4_NEPGR|nr:hypothetical protein Nepgr_025970 [Nepenthes gracilis]